MRVRLFGLIAVLVSTQEASAQDRQRFLYLLPEGFRGWACVEFGVADAAPLPREGDTLLIRVLPGQTIKTSDTVGLIPPTGEARIEVQGKREPLPKDVYGRKMSALMDTKSPVAHQCVFFGTEDAADAAGEAPGLERSRHEAGGISPEERGALIALYEATNGSQWTHRVGWLGPPGSECSWHGVDCDPRFGETTVVKSLKLFDNNLVGEVPRGLAQLTHLESLYVFGNRMKGKLPEVLLERWLAGLLEISSDPSLVTDVSEISYESESASLLCAHSQVVLREDGTATAHATRCRHATPDDRATFCEVKAGRLFPGAFGRLGALVERSGYFALKPEYSRNVSDSGEAVTRVTRGAATHQVTNYATAGPMELWSIQRAIEGVAATVEWETATRQPECPSGTRAP